MQADFTKQGGMLPAIVQDNETGKILMLAYMTEESLKITLETNRATFLVEAEIEFGQKGEESGNFLEVVSIELDCDKDTFLIKAKPRGPVCHKGTDTCWAEDNVQDFSFLHILEKVILDRKANPKEGSYTNSLLNKGINKIAQKVGEEAIEVVIEAKDDNKDLFLGESADLLYHFLVLLAAKGYSFNEVLAKLKSRHQ